MISYSKKFRSYKPKSRNNCWNPNKNKIRHDQDYQDTGSLKCNI